MTTVTILILLIFLVSIYYFFKDRDKNLALNVDSLGGMYTKYKILVDSILKETGTRISKEERDRLIIECNLRLGKGQYIITESFGEIEIIWSADLGRFGKEYKKWTFNTSTPQAEMLKEIRKYKLTLI